MTHTAPTTSDAFVDSNELSLDAHWMPFTANRQFKKAPRLFVGAKDMHYTTTDGRKVLDGTAGLWCVNAGHCREHIVKAVQQQAATMDYSPAFQMGQPMAFQLASRLAGMLPEGMSRVFFVNSGSEAVDTALKMALAYHGARGEPSRVKFIGRQRGYHGVGFGGISVGGIPANQAQFRGQLLPGVDHIVHTHDPARNAFSKGQPTRGAELADDLEAVVAKHGAETIAAVIVEPIAGSTGVLIPPVGYLERLRAICDKHGILLIFDEVITGFGRLGAPFAAQKFNVVPDLITVAKGLTNAAVPMGAVFARSSIYETVVERSTTAIELFHGYTYSGHPLACAAGLAALDIYEGEGLFERAAAMAPKWEEAVHSLRGLPHVIDVRNLGLVAGVELASRDGAPGTRAFDLFLDCFNNGALIRTTGDIAAMSPPLIISESQIDELIGTVAAGLRKLQ